MTTTPIPAAAHAPIMRAARDLAKMIIDHAEEFAMTFGEFENANDPTDADLDLEIDLELAIKRRMINLITARLHFPD